MVDRKSLIIIMMPKLVKLFVIHKPQITQTAQPSIPRLQLHILILSSVYSHHLEFRRKSHLCKSLDAKFG